MDSSPTLDLSAAISRAGLSAHADAITRLARPCVRIGREQVPTEDLTPQDSFFGGAVAFLPPGAEWPMRGQWALEPVASILLSQASPNDASGRLPRSGRVTFWYDQQESPWGFDPADRAGFRVTYIPDESTPLERCAAPAPFCEWRTDEDAPPACRLSFSRGVTLPHTSWADLPPEQQAVVSLDGYDDLLTLIGQTPMPAHRLLGYPNLVQSPMEDECQLASNGINCGGSEKIDEERAKQLESGIPDWMLLLQLDTDEDDGPGWCWGDSGLLYFWIRQQDLARASFDNCWQVLQCY